MSEMVEFFDIFWDDKLTRLKEHVDNKKEARGRWPKVRSGRP
jgi:hypothetical protein